MNSTLDGSTKRLLSRVMGDILSGEAKFYDGSPCSSICHFSRAIAILDELLRNKLYASNRYSLDRNYLCKFNYKWAGEDSNLRPSAFESEEVGTML